MNEDGVIPAEDFKAAIAVCCRDPTFNRYYIQAPAGARMFIGFQFYARVFSALLEEEMYSQCISEIEPELSLEDVDYMLGCELEKPQVMGYLRDLKVWLEDDLPATPVVPLRPIPAPAPLPHSSRSQSPAPAVAARPSAIPRPGMASPTTVAPQAREGSQPRTMPAHRDNALKFIILPALVVAVLLIGLVIANQRGMRARMHVPSLEAVEESPRAESPEAPVVESKAQEVTIPKAEVVEAKSPEVKAPEVTIPKAEVVEAKSPEVKAPEVTIPKAEVAEAKSPEVKAPEVTIPKVEVSEAVVPTPVPTTQPEARPQVVQSSPPPVAKRDTEEERRQKHLREVLGAFRSAGFAFWRGDLVRAELEAVPPGALLHCMLPGTERGGEVYELSVREKAPPAVARLFIGKEAEKVAHADFLRRVESEPHILLMGKKAHVCLPAPAKAAKKLLASSKEDLDPFKLALGTLHGCLDQLGMKGDLFAEVSFVPAGEEVEITLGTVPFGRTIAAADIRRKISDWMAWRSADAVRRKVIRRVTKRRTVVLVESDVIGRNAWGAVVIPKAFSLDAVDGPGYWFAMLCGEDMSRKEAEARAKWQAYYDAAVRQQNEEDEDSEEDFSAYAPSEAQLEATVRAGSVLVRGRR